MRNSLTDRIAQAIGDPGSIVTRANGETVTRWSTRAVEHVLDPEAREIRAGERLRVLEEIVALANDKDGLRELVENAAGDPDGKTSLSRARSLLRELAAIGGPLDTATGDTAPQPPGDES